MVLGQGEGVILPCAGKGFFSVCFQSHLLVPCPTELTLREALGLSWTWRNGTITLTEEGAVLVSAGCHHRVSGSLDNRNKMYLFKP